MAWAARHACRSNFSMTFPIRVQAVGDGEGSSVGSGVGRSVGTGGVSVRIGVGTSLGTGGVSVGVGMSVGTGVSVGVGVGMSVDVGIGVGLSSGLGETQVSAGLGIGDDGPAVALGRGRCVVMATARRIVFSPLSVAGCGAGFGSGAALGTGSGAGLGSLASMGEVSVADARWGRVPRDTSAKAITRTSRARLAATSVGANIGLIENHKAFLRMALSLPASRRSLPF